MLPSDRLKEVVDVVRETLVTADARFITALAPVLVRNVDELHLVRVQLALAGLERRLFWVGENTLAAVDADLNRPSVPKEWGALYRRARVLLGAWLASVTPSATAPDILDPTIRSERTKEEVERASSSISRRWGIITPIQPKDFVDALRDARGSA